MAISKSNKNPTQPNVNKISKLDIRHLYDYYNRF